MRLGRAIKRQARAAAAPCVFLALFGYFCWGATQGDRGLRASTQRREALAAALSDQQHAQADLAAWQQRVGALRNTRLDLDALDARSRAMLNLSEADDIVVPLRP